MTTYAVTCDHEGRIERHPWVHNLNAPIVADTFADHRNALASGHELIDAAIERLQRAKVRLDVRIENEPPPSLRTNRERIDSQPKDYQRLTRIWGWH